MTACLNGSQEVVKYLIAHGADVNFCDQVKSVLQKVSICNKCTRFQLVVPTTYSTYIEKYFLSDSSQRICCFTGGKQCACDSRETVFQCHCADVAGPRC